MDFKQKLKLWLQNFATYLLGLIATNPMLWLTVLVLAGALGVILLFGWAFGSCGQKKIERIETNINAGKANINALAVNENTQKGVEINADKNSIIVNGNFANSINRDSSQFDGNRANSRYCARFPNDSSCR